MKKILALCALVLVAGSFALYRSLRAPRLFGAFTGAPRADVAELASRPQDFRRKTLAIEGVIREQCTTMGCYFFFHEGDKTLRVDLAEVAMQAPKHRNGRRARVEGQLVPYDHGWQFWASAVEFE